MERVEPTENYFSKHFEYFKLVDDDPIKVVRTWRNSRRGKARISKILHRLFLAENITEWFLGLSLG